MDFRLSASTEGPLADMTEILGFPASLDWNSREPHQLWSLVDSGNHSSSPDAWAILPAGVAAISEFLAPRFDSVDDWLPGMTLLRRRRSTLSATASGEVSALWTGIAAPLKTALAGDIGLDLDLGLRAQAQWTARRDCWWSIERPSAAHLLRVKLFSDRSSSSAISVKGVAVAGLDQATRNALAVILGQHRTQILEKLRQGVSGLTGGLPAAEATVQEFLSRWLALPPVTQSEQWRNPEDPILAALKNSIETLAIPALAQADQLTARLELAAVRTLEKNVEAGLSAAFDRQRSSTAILDADFDFTANPALNPVFRRCLDGDLNPLVSEPLAGITVHSCAFANDLSRRQTFTWRLPFLSGFTSNRERLQTAMQALDSANGRIVRGSAKAESERRTRSTSSLLSLEGVFAARLGAGVIVHDAAAVNARFVLDLKTRRPLTLQPLLDLYGAGPADPLGKGCRLEINLDPECVAPWLKPQDPAEVSLRLQTAWRTLLPAAVDTASFNARSIAPLLVWASLPVSTAARCTSRGLQLNRGGSLYWDWADRQLREAMVWNPQTRAALELRLGNAHFDADPDQLRRTVAQPPGAAVFVSLLQTEAEFIERLTSALRRASGSSASNPAGTMRHLSALLAGLVSAFHGKLTSVYGEDAARALGPLLLCSASPQKPKAEVTWSR